MKIDGLEMNTNLSKSELLLMLEIIHSSLSCKSSDAFHGLIDRVKDLLGFSHIRSLFGDCSEYSKKKMGALKMLTAFPEDWEIRYNQNDYFLYDNIAVTAFHSKGLIYWTDHVYLQGIDDKRNEKSREIMAEAASVGLKEGWLYSMQGRRSSERAILSIAGEKCEKCDRSKKILEYLSPHLCLAVKRIILDRNETPVRLTPREYEVLSWAAAGKTAWEISEILNISRRTVEFHMGNIMDKLDAVNSQQAIAIAFSANMVKY
jgi:LuxR family quorum sensing-dependent transcriptional regulator